MSWLDSRFVADGFEIVRDVLDAAECQSLIAASSGVTTRAGSRRLLELAWCRELARRLKTFPGISQHLPTAAVAVQCTLFDKSVDRNWLVSLHQDLAIPVSAKVSAVECSGWSSKEGMTFVQPPDDVLAQLVAVRVHLDESTPDNGPLRVVPGSHRSGRLSTADAAKLRGAAGEVICTAECGSVILLRPLLLHASSKAEIAAPRRVLHFLFGPPELPSGLNWRWAI